MTSTASTAPSSASTSSTESRDDRAQALAATVRHVGHLLPTQGPIGVFVHHNTLHAFQHLPFHTAVAQASDMFGAHDYMSEPQYHAAFARGRITLDDLRYALEQDMSQRAANDTHDLAPSHAPTAPRDERLHRDVVLALTGVDVHTVVHAFLVRTLGAYLDTGAAYWEMPERARGYHATVVTLYGRPGQLSPPLLRGLEAALRRQRIEGQSASDVVLEHLETLGIAPADHAAYLTRLLLTLPGWAGMMHRLELNPDDRPADAPPARLLDLIAVWLTLECVALAQAMRDELDDPSPLASLLTRATADNDVRVELSQRADELNRRRSAEIFAPLGAQAGRARRRIWHEAYERFHRQQVLDAISVVAQARPTESTTPKLHVLFCIDDREESFRRHLEEQDRDIVTFGLAGFFGLAIRYRGLDDGHYSTLCPVVVTPGHVIEEVPHDHHAHARLLRSRRRKLWARVLHLTHTFTRSLTRAALLTPVLGALSAIPLVLRVLFPRTAGLLSRAFADRAAPRIASRLASDPEDYKEAAASSLRQGFSLDEQARLVAAQLENIGLKRDFAPLVLVLGHGSSSVNNPHKSAYDCGACGGSVGAPNARLFAQLANKPEVRARLKERGIEITDATWFVGGYHDTGNDAVPLFDTERIPATHTAHFERALAALERARRLDAHERCRRLASAPHDASPETALRHVEERTHDLSQARPELGHCTNAVCVVGRRALTRSLFLDRRAFLVSYDAQQDTDHRVLERILAAVGPVGAGINLEYYFSFVDNQRYGCGSKLPHNLTGLLGVMDGAGSDLRTGLPQQMIELHEPVRLLVVVEATPEALLAVAERQAEVRELVLNRWIQLASVDPHTGELRYFNGRDFEPHRAHDTALPSVTDSRQWYAGKTAFWDFLPPALIGALPHAPAAATQGTGAKHV